MDRLSVTERWTEGLIFRLPLHYCVLEFKVIPTMEKHGFTLDNPEWVLIEDIVRLRARSIMGIITTVIVYMAMDDACLNDLDRVVLSQIMLWLKDARLEA